MNNRHDFRTCHAVQDYAASRHLWDTPLFGSDLFVALPTVGPLIEGWLLVVPRKHILSFSELSAPQFSELEDLLNDVVPVMEEIFWRAFLLRFVIDEHFEQVPFGKFSWLSFAIVTVAFTFSHSRPTGSQPSSAACSTMWWLIAAAAWLRAFLPTLPPTCSWDCGSCRPASGDSGDCSGGL